MAKKKTLQELLAEVEKEYPNIALTREQMAERARLLDGEIVPFKDIPKES